MYELTMKFTTALNTMGARNRAAYFDSSDFWILVKAWIFLDHQNGCRHFPILKEKILAVQKLRVCARTFGTHCKIFEPKFFYFDSSEKIATNPQYRYFNIYEITCCMAEPTNDGVIRQKKNMPQDLKHQALVSWNTSSNRTSAHTWPKQHNNDNHHTVNHHTTFLIHQSGRNYVP